MSQNSDAGILIAVIVSAGIGYWYGSNNPPTPKANYGKTGLPVNCVAIVDTNVRGVQSGLYNPIEALGSISRNCGSNGSSLDQ